MAASVNSASRTTPRYSYIALHISYYYFQFQREQFNVISLVNFYFQQSLPVIFSHLGLNYFSVSTLQNDPGRPGVSYIH